MPGINLFNIWYKNIVKIESIGLCFESFSLLDKTTRKIPINIHPIEASGDITFSSSDSNIVAVDNIGNITAINNGTATITATYKDFSSTTLITVELLDPSKYTLISVTPSKIVSRYNYGDKINNLYDIWLEVKHTDSSGNKKTHYTIPNSISYKSKLDTSILGDYIADIVYSETNQNQFTKHLSITVAEKGNWDMEWNGFNGESVLPTGWSLNNASISYDERDGIYYMKPNVNESDEGDIFLPSATKQVDSEIEYSYLVRKWEKVDAPNDGDWVTGVFLNGASGQAEFGTMSGINFNRIVYNGAVNGYGTVVDNMQQCSERIKICEGKLYTYTNSVIIENGIDVGHYNSDKLHKIYSINEIVKINSIRWRKI